jgi:hypothetical protein
MLVSNLQLLAILHLPILPQLIAVQKFFLFKLLFSTVFVMFLESIEKSGKTFPSQDSPVA